MTLEFEAPIRIESEMNRREFWAVRKKRFDKQKWDVRYSYLSAHYVARATTSFEEWIVPGHQFTVTLTRIGPRKLDDDNLAGGFKAARDQIAALIGIDDGNERIRWTYLQRKGKPKEYAAHIKIESQLFVPDEDIPF